jgi:hypothetical protein
MGLKPVPLAGHDSQAPDNSKPGKSLGRKAMDLKSLESESKESDQDSQATEQAKPVKTGVEKH